MARTTRITELISRLYQEHGIQVIVRMRSLYDIIEIPHKDYKGKKVIHTAHSIDNLKDFLRSFERVERAIQEKSNE